MPDRLQVTPVQTRRDMREFIALPWRLYRGNPAWVPPLLLDLKKLLDPRKHPFHRHAEVGYFLARRGPHLVGRIAAVVNHQYVGFHEDRTGFFGFFESLDDQETATALLTTAERWVTARGMQRIHGPMNFSTNEECGLLIDDFLSPPVIMMPYNLPYYAPLIESAGYLKAKDLMAYLIDDTTPPERLVRGVASLQERYDITIRPISLAHFQRDVAQLLEVYNSAWERNWGFVPMTEDETADLARQLRRIGDPRLCLLAESKGEPVGFALALPDYNQALRHINGRLLPFGFLKLLWHRRHIDTARVLALGLKPEFRRLGLDAMLYLHLWRIAPAIGFPRVECSWILEDNRLMRRGLERAGARPYKTYRVYEKTFPS